MLHLLCWCDVDASHISRQHLDNLLILLVISLRDEGDNWGIGIGVLRKTIYYCLLY